MRYFFCFLLLIGGMLSNFQANGQIAPPESVQAFLKIENTGQEDFDPANNTGSIQNIDVEVRAIIELPDTSTVHSIHITFDASNQNLLDEVVAFDAVSNAANLFYERDGNFVTLVLGSYSGLSDYMISCKLEDHSGLMSDPVNFSN